MWTPRRIFLLVGCFVAFFLVYLGYAYTAVGRIDGLPPLPEAFWPNPEAGTRISHRQETVSKLDARLKEAFGADCKELKFPIRLEVHSRNMLIAAEQFKVMDGKVYLTPLSVALFGKKKHDNLPSEINTIRSEVAILTFDRPVTSITEIAGRKIAEAELNGRIVVISNRRRVQRDQDLKVLIDNGPLYYKESTHRIWTEAVVTVEDHKSQPHHLIRGQGMEMELLTEAQQKQPAGRKAGKDTITGVKWGRLNSGVDMTFYQEGQQGGLMSSGKTPPVATPVATKKGVDPSKKSKMHITTPGSFLYELNKDHDVATFNVQPAGPIASRRDVPQHVVATRTNTVNQAVFEDHLICHQLVLRLRRKDPGAAPPAGATKPSPNAKPATNSPAADDRIEGVEIESIHALADLTRPTSEVVLVANSEDGLRAEGRDFFHDTTRGLTILKGIPVKIDRLDGSKVNAQEIRIQNITPPSSPGKPPPKAYQEIWAAGPGDLLMIDKEKKVTKAFWQKLLTSTRDGDQDLLTLTGAARFVDEQADQSLRSDTLKVWIDPPENKQATDRKEGISAGRKPRHLEATGNVVGRSRDINIHDTSRLIVRFKDEPPQAILPAPAGMAPLGPARRVNPPAGPGGVAPTVPPASRKPLPSTAPGTGQLTGRATAPTVAGAGPTLDPAVTPPPPARPFDLTARTVEAWILRGTVKSSIDQLYCDGNVIVRQDPAKAEERGTEVKGDTLRMTAGGDGGYFLVVTADQDNVAELMTDKIYIIGPEVNVDQTTNKAWVIGGGAMKMESATNFQGEKLEKTVPLTIHWDKSMLFNGESAEFQGNITGEQDKARLACQHLQVNFDRPISLKQGNKTDQPARVRQMLCDGSVRIEEAVFTGPKLTKWTLVMGPVVHMTALEPDEDVPLRPAKPGGKTNTGNVVVVSGAGNVRIWEPSSGEDLPGLTGPTSAGKPAPGPAKPTPKKTPEMKMTYVAFKNRMDANSKTNKASFWGSVRILNMPCPRHDAVINLDTILATDLPEGAVYISCARLHVLDRPTDGKSNKKMEGHGQVYTEGREFKARSQSIYYDQLKEQIILDGTESTPAELEKVTRVGAEAQRIEGRRIIYNRKTGKIDVQTLSGINAETQK